MDIQTLRSAGRGLILATLVACTVAATGPARAQVEQIPGTPTSLSSTADRMISYRSQHHMWQTADGATHVVINRGPLRGGRSLVLFSTFDGGLSWVDSGVALPSSNGSSTSDGYLNGNRLHITYDAGTSVIRYAEIDYDPASKSWAANVNEVAFQSTTAAALTPAMARDALGRQWLSFTHQDKATGNFSIKMVLKATASDPWVDTGFTFGPVDNVSNERSGRPIATSRGVGMIFTVKEQTYWTERNNQWALTQAWPRALVYTKEVPSNDPYGTHFSIVADADFNMHMVSVDGGRMVYSRYLVADRVWTNTILTDNLKTSYVQATLAGGNVVLIGNSYTNLSVLQSTDGGTTFTRTHALTHAAPPEGTSYDRPRLETPGVSTSPIPVLQQFSEGRVQRAMFFAVPTVAPAPAN